jgi:hypothetical protein
MLNDDKINSVINSKEITKPIVWTVASLQSLCLQLMENALNINLCYPSPNPQNELKFI